MPIGKAILEKLHADPACRKLMDEAKASNLAEMPAARRMLSSDELTWLRRLAPEALRGHVAHFLANSKTGALTDERRRAAFAGSDPRAGGGFVGASFGGLQAKLRDQQTAAAMEESRLLIAKRYGARGPERPGAFVRTNGETHLYLHRIGGPAKAKPDVLRSIADNGLRAAQATGLFGQREGVYALDMTGGRLPDKSYTGDIYALFLSAHPCVVGEHINPETAWFPLSAGKLIDTQHCIFLTRERDDTFTVLDEDGVRRWQLPSVDGRLTPDFDLTKAASV